MPDDHLCWPRYLCRRLAGWLVALLSFLGCANAGAVGPAIAIDKRDNALEIRAGESTIAVFSFRDAVISRPYFAHLAAPGGVQVSRRHPPVEGQDAIDHALLHPGLWLAFGDLSGNDSWRLSAPIRFAGFVEPPSTADGAASFACRLEHMTNGGGELLAVETFRVAVAELRSGYVLFLDSSFTPAGEEIVFGDQEEIGLGVRLATPLAVKAGGKITNSRGQVNEKQLWGKPAAWCDYEGVVEGRRAGILLAPHPDNFRESRFHARDYGVLVANPFGVRAFGGDEASRVVIRRGESLRLRFAVLLHSAPADAAWSPSEAFAEISRRWRE